jgi:hypothetical protein
MGMEVSIFVWGLLICCIVAGGILTGEWGPLFSRIQAGVVQTGVVEDARRLVPNQRATQLFLIAAGLSFVASVFAWFCIDHTAGLFIGLWVPSILSLGCLLTSQTK